MIKILLSLIVVAVGCANPTAGNNEIDMTTVSVTATDSTSIYRVPVDPELSIVSMELFVGGGWQYIDQFGDDDFDIGINAGHDTMFIFNYTASVIRKIRITEIYRR
jgi:hypothetical protein